MNYLFPPGGQRGTTVQVTASGTFDAWPLKSWVSGPGVTAVPAKEKGKLAVTVAADAVPGTYWMRLHNDNGASAPRAFIVGTLPEVAEAEPNDDPAHAQPIDRSTVVNGRLSKSGDADCFAVKLTKGQTLVASLEANGSLRSPMDAALQIVSPDGFVLSQGNDYHGLDPQLAFTAPRDGTFVARVFAFPSTPDSTIRFSGADTYIYRLTLTTGGFAEHAAPLAVSREKPGAVAVAGYNVPAAARQIAVTPADEYGIVSHPLVANAVRVRVEPHACHTLVAKKPNGPFAPPFSATGEIGSPGVPEVVLLQAKKGAPLTVQVESRAFGFALSPALRVLDSAGKVLTLAEPTALDKDCELTFTPAADGVFRVEIRDQYAHAGPQHGFLLRVVAAEPDFSLTLSTDRVVVPPGKATDVPVTVTRRNGFAKVVVLDVTGLPPGVTAAGKGDGKTIQLRFTADAAGFSGPIRVTGKADGASGRTRTATAVVAETEAATPDLWLAVTSAGGPPPMRQRKK